MAATNKNKAAAAAKEKAANGTVKANRERKSRGHVLPTNSKELAQAMKRQGAKHARKVEKTPPAPAQDLGKKIALTEGDDLHVFTKQEIARGATVAMIAKAAKEAREVSEEVYNTRLVELMRKAAGISEINQAGFGEPTPQELAPGKILGELRQFDEADQTEIIISVLQEMKQDRARQVHAHECGLANARKSAAHLDFKISQS